VDFETVGGYLIKSLGVQDILLLIGPYFTSWQLCVSVSHYETIEIHYILVDNVVFNNIIWIIKMKGNYCYISGVRKLYEICYPKSHCTLILYKLL